MKLTSAAALLIILLYLSPGITVQDIDIQPTTTEERSESFERRQQMRKQSFFLKTGVSVRFHTGRWMSRG